MGVLGQILEAKRSEVLALRGRRWPAPPPRRPVELRRGPADPLWLITELKRRSPSAGPLSTQLGVAERARVYERGGARLVSVLTDQRFFDGAFEHLTEVRDACALPVLCKDFVIDEVQLDAARAHGADAVLIIARCLAPERVLALVQAALERELCPLLEISGPDEVELAIASGAALVGVNARDLDILEMNPERAARTLSALPAALTRVHLSGLAGADDVARVARTGADAALIGEALMRKDDPSELLGQMLAATWARAPGNG